MEIFTDFTPEEREKLHESMTKTFNPLDEKEKDEEKDNNTDD